MWTIYKYSDKSKKFIEETETEEEAQEICLKLNRSDVISTKLYFFYVFEHKDDIPFDPD